MRKTLFFGLTAACTCALIVAACSGTPQSPSSPSAVSGGSNALNPDGSTLKVTAPAGLSPSGGETIDTLKPTLRFNNATGKFVPIGLAYELEVYKEESGALVYSRVIGESANTSSHTLDADLEYATNYFWRVRGRLSSDTAPWAAAASFRTLDRPGPTPGAPGALPFPIPAECGPSESQNRFTCVLAVAGLSEEWARCARGIGIGCHRFTRQVVYSLSRSDPNWKMIMAQPGGHACNCSACGPSDGTMFREDTTVYGGNRVYDMIVGAGGSSPSLNWSFVGAPRPGDLPNDAPPCVP